MKDSLSEDSELLAMQSLVKALQPLDEQARRRVFVWTRDKFGFGPGGSTPVLIQKKSTDTESSSVPEAGTSPAASARKYNRYPSFAEFYHALSPKTDGERALTAAAWMQDTSYPEGFDSFSVNKLLKNLGYGVGNITRSFDALMDGQPAAIMQLRKAGTSQQARKSYKVTDAGFKRIQNILSADPQGAE